MKNKLTDLNNHLFAQIERLDDDELKGEDLKNEVIRAHAMTVVAREVINNGRLAFDAAKAVHENYLDAKSGLPQLLVG